jgi:hypothetical protein
VRCPRAALAIDPLVTVFELLIPPDLRFLRGGFPAFSEEPLGWLLRGGDAFPEEPGDQAA